MVTNAKMMIITVHSAPNLCTYINTKLIKIKPSAYTDWLYKQMPQNS